MPGLNNGMRLNVNRSACIMIVDDGRARGLAELMSRYDAGNSQGATKEEPWAVGGASSE